MSQSAAQPTPVASPCIKVCILDGQGICKGCGRTLEEIASWSQLPPAQQRKVCELAVQRRGLTLTAEPGSWPSAEFGPRPGPSKR